ASNLPGSAAIAGAFRPQILGTPDVEPPAKHRSCGHVSSVDRRRRRRQTGRPAVYGTGVGRAGVVGQATGIGLRGEGRRGGAKMHSRSPQRRIGTLRYFGNHFHPRAQSLRRATGAGADGHGRRRATGAGAGDHGRSRTGGPTTGGPTTGGPTTGGPTTGGPTTGGRASWREATPTTPTRWGNRAGRSGCAAPGGQFQQVVEHVLTAGA